MKKRIALSERQSAFFGQSFISIRVILFCVRATDPDGYVGAFSSTQKITIKARWLDNYGEAIGSGAGTVGTGF